MIVKFWGVRGSIPTPLTGECVENKIRKALHLAKPGDLSSMGSIDDFINSLPFSLRNTYGGNSTAIEIRTDSGQLIMLDCGSGIINFGKELMKGEFGTGKGAAHILMTHSHWDHIQGIPFFLPFYVPGNRFNFYSPIPDLRERLDHQQVFSHFPVDLDYLQASKRFFRLGAEEELYLGNVRVLNKRMPHPGRSFGYRIEENDKAFVYTSDCEFNLDTIDEIEAYRDFFIDADLVAFDTQYTFDEAMDKIDYGHSSASMAIDIAAKFNIKNLLLFHHDPNYDDEKLDEVLINAKTYMNTNFYGEKKLKVDIAKEGAEYDL